MGDVADMMLDGTLCEGCGVFLNASPPGHPCYCSKACRADRTPAKVPHFPLLPKVKCPDCGHKVNPTGLADHKRDAHGVSP